MVASLASFVLTLTLFAVHTLKTRGQNAPLGVGPHNFDYLLGEGSNFNTAASVVFVDYEDVSAATIKGIKSKGKRVICYVNVGAWEDWRSDASSFPSSVLGKDYDGWPGEKWLDIRKVDVLIPIMKKRFQKAQSKGCEGVDPDNMNGYQNDSGFQLSAQDQLTYNRALSASIKSLGLLAGLKNDPDQTKDLVDSFDFVVVESCAYEGACAAYDIFVQRSKPVFAVEYTDLISESKFRSSACPLRTTKKLSFVYKKLDLKNDFTVVC